MRRHFKSKLRNGKGHQKSQLKSLYTTVCHMLTTDKGYEWARSFSPHNVHFFSPAYFSKHYLYHASPFQF